MTLSTASRWRRWSATRISALVGGAAWLEPPARDWALRIAGDWNARVEGWTVVLGTALARAQGVDGYYVRIMPPPGPGGASQLSHILPIKNRVCDPRIPADEQLATDFLQLVRLGLRDAQDPLVLDTIKVIDSQLKVDTPSGPAWHRFTGDGYGEHVDGRPFDGTGRGRAWPLLTGERGHYELVAGRDAMPYLVAMAAMTGRCGLMPEQVWDAEAIAERSLEPGKPTGSAMPLVWAHAEFVKLVASRTMQRPFDRPEAVWQRYRGKRPDPTHAIWTPRFRITQIRSGQTLCLCLPGPARVHFGFDGWQNVAGIDTRDSGLGLHVATLPTMGLASGARVDFTLFWIESAAWDGHDYTVDVGCA